MLRGHHTQTGFIVEDNTFGIPFCTLGSLFRVPSTLIESGQCSLFISDNEYISS